MAACQVVSCHFVSATYPWCFPGMTSCDNWTAWIGPNASNTLLMSVSDKSWRKEFVNGSRETKEKNKEINLLKGDEKIGKPKSMRVESIRKGKIVFENVQVQHFNQLCKYVLPNFSQMDRIHKFIKKWFRLKFISIPRWLVVKIWQKTDFIANNFNDSRKICSGRLGKVRCSKMFSRATFLNGL